MVGMTVGGWEWDGGVRSARMVVRQAMVRGILGRGRWVLSMRKWMLVALLVWLAVVIPWCLYLAEHGLPFDERGV